MNSYQKLLKDINEAQDVVCGLKRQLDSLNIREISVTITDSSVYVETSDCFHEDKVILLKEPLNEDAVFKIVNRLRNESSYCQVYYIRSEGSSTDVTISAPSTFYPAILNYIINVTMRFSK